MRLFVAEAAMFRAEPFQDRISDHCLSACARMHGACLTGWSLLGAEGARRDLSGISAEGATEAGHEWGLTCWGLKGEAGPDWWLS